MAEINIEFLIGMLRQSLGIEAAEQFVNEAITDAGVSRKVSYTEPEFNRICEALHKNGRYLKIVAAVASRSTYSEIYCQEIGKERKEKEDLTRLSDVLEQKVKERTRELEREIAERKKAEETLKDSEERLKILFECAPDAYYLYDLKGNFVDGNKAAEELIGYKKEEIIGKNFLNLKLIPPKYILKLSADLARNILGLPTGPDEFILNRKDGNSVIVETRAFPVKIKGKSVGLGIARDITARKHAEEALEKALKELKELDKMKDEFFSSAAHDLQNPLTPISCQSELLLTGHFGELNEKQKRSVETILRNANRIIRLTEDIMTISRMRAGVLKFDLIENNIGDIIETSAENMESMAKEKHIAVIKKYPSLLPRVKCDKDRINQVLENLIGNSIKFTPDGGKIIIGAEMNKNDKNYIIVSVEDTGIGISEENQKKIFNAFFRVNGSKYNGTGLGLAICKNMLAAHHGELWVESELGKGSKFRFTLPVIQH